MATVYLLTAGEHSDYRVIGAFSSQDRLEAAIKSCERDRFNSVEEHEVDEIPEDACGPAFLTTIDLENGSVRQRHETWPQPRKADGACKISIVSLYGPSGPSCVHVVSPVSADHATKIAIEKRQEWLRTGEIVGAKDIR